MHSGRDTGFGGMGFTPASQGGTHIVERNLTRLTCAVATGFGDVHGLAVPPARLAYRPGPEPAPVTLNAAVAIAGTR